MLAAADDAAGGGALAALGNAWRGAVATPDPAAGGALATIAILGTGARAVVERAVRATWGINGAIWRSCGCQAEGAGTAAATRGSGAGAGMALGTVTGALAAAARALASVADGAGPSATPLLTGDSPAAYGAGALPDCGVTGAVVDAGRAFELADGAGAAARGVCACAD